MGGFVETISLGRPPVREGAAGAAVGADRPYSAAGTPRGGRRLGHAGARRVLPRPAIQQRQRPFTADDRTPGPDLRPALGRAGVENGAGGFRRHVAARGGFRGPPGPRLLPLL